MPIILVTGATDGIGKETARELVRRGATVLVHGRTAAKARASCDEVRGARAVHGDLSSLAEVRALADRIDDVDVVVHNAGVFLNERTTTTDGFETTFAVNHLAPFLLTHLLLPKLLGKPDARVVVVSSMAHRRGRIDFDDLQLERHYDGYSAYANSKLMNVLFAFDLARRVPFAVNALHPGVISTKLLRTGFGMNGAPVDRGARTSVKLAVDDSVRGVTGKYFSDEHETEASPLAHDERLQRRLYEVSAKLVGVEAIARRGER